MLTFHTGTVANVYLPVLLVFINQLLFLANVNSSSCSLYVVVRPSVVCRLSVFCTPSLAIFPLAEINWIQI